MPYGHLPGFGYRADLVTRTVQISGINLLAMTAY